MQTDNTPVECEGELTFLLNWNLEENVSNSAGRSFHDSPVEIHRNPYSDLARRRRPEKGLTQVVLQLLPDAPVHNILQILSIPFFCPPPVHLLYHAILFQKFGQQV